MEWKGKPKADKSRLRFSYTVGKDKQWLNAWLRNSCPREVCTTTKKELPLESDVEIEFLQPGTRTMIVFSGTVIRSDYLQEHNCFYNEILLKNTSDLQNKDTRQIKKKKK